MNWGKLKSFLIGLFLIINIFLIITMISQERKNTSIPVQTINDTVSVLEKNDILINASIIPTDVKNMGEITVIPITKSESFKDVTYSSDDNMFEINVNKGVFNSQDMKSVLSGLGIKNFKVSKEYSNGLGSVSQMAGGYPIFEAGVDVESDGIVSFVKGDWYELKTKAKKNSDYNNLVFLPSILINYISNKLRPIGEQTITDINYGYYVLNNTSNAIIYTAVPCWQIEVDDAMFFYYNAINGEYITMLSIQ